MRVDEEAIVIGYGKQRKTLGGTVALNPVIRRIYKKLKIKEQW